MKYFTRYILLIILNLIFTEYTFSQSNTDFEMLSKVKIYTPDTKTNYSTYLNEHNSTKIIFASLFLFYKKFVSSQDISNCPFSPSCSEYFIQSIYKKGLILGTLNGFDRYKRCIGHDMDKYKMDNEKKYYLDPVDYN